jgi:hypothetical protein
MLFYIKTLDDIDSFLQGRESGYTFGFWSEYADFIDTNYSPLKATYKSTYEMIMSTDTLVQVIF